jgi:hypothetical protein
MSREFKQILIVIDIFYNNRIKPLVPIPTEIDVGLARPQYSPSSQPGG